MSVLKILLALAVIALGSGCLYTNLHSNVEERWGEAFEANMAEQTANRGLPTEVTPEGMDAETAKRVAGGYYKGQERRKQRQIPSVLIQPSN